MCVSCVCAITTFQQQKPEKVWLTRHWIRLFLGTEGCWSVRIPISSKQSLPVTHSDPLHLSHTAQHTLLRSLIIQSSLLLFFFTLNTVSHFLSDPFIRSHKEKSCLTVPPPPPLRHTKHSLFLFTLSFQANSEERKRGRKRGESLRIAGPSYFPEMLQPIPKLWANEGGSFTTHALLLQ